MSTSAAFPSSLFEHIVVNSCSESSIRFVRGSSSRYCCVAVAGYRPARRQTRAQEGRQEAGWTRDGLTDPQYDIAQGGQGTTRRGIQARRERTLDDTGYPGDSRSTDTPHRRVDECD